MRVASINWLTLLESCKGPRGGGCLDLKYRIGQVLVKPSAFDYSDGLQIVLKQQIEIVGMRGSECWITYCHPVAALLHSLEMRKTGDVRPRDTPPVRCADGAV